MKIKTGMREILSLYDRMGQRLREGRHQEALELARQALEIPGLSDSQRAQFLYCRAIALDYSAQHEDALQILEELLEKSPDSLTYQYSIRIVLRKLILWVFDWMKRDPTAEGILLYEKRLMAHKMCPWVIRLHCAKLRALAGDVQEPIAMIKAYLALSPNDSDYLKGGIELARIVRDEAFLEDLLAHVSELYRRQPYRFELGELLEGE
jgi:tetratricopeptide (TPR) repeat protein